MERDTLEHLLGRMRTDVRLQGLCVVGAAEDPRDSDLMGLEDTAHAALSGWRWGRDGDEEHAELMWR